MWNNFLEKIVKYCHFVATWNEINPPRAAAHFTCRSHISRTKCISQIPQGIYFVEKSTCFRKCFFLAPPTGLEPVTPWLTVRCSTDWAKEECLKIFWSETVKLTASNTIFSRIGSQPNSFRFAKSRKYAIYLINKADDWGWTLCRLLHLCRLWAIVPARLQASIVATAKLNFCVRNGNRWTLCVWNTDFWSRSYRFSFPCRKPE